MATTLIAKLWTKIVNKKVPQSVMIVGLDNSGKTSILNYLATLNSTLPTSKPNKSTCNNDNTNSIISNKHHFDYQNQPIINEYQNESLWTSSSSSFVDFVDNNNFSDNNKQTNNNNNNNGGVNNNNNNNIMPTAGYNYERIQFKGSTLTVLDFSGQNRYRNLWQEFYNSVDGIVFVIDSSDLIRFVVARDELETMLNHPYFNSLDYQSLDCNNNNNNNIPLQTSKVNLIAQKQILISQGKLIQSPLETSSSSPSLSSISGVGKNTNLFNNSNLQQKRGRRENNPKRRTKVPILFLANKSDLANSVETEVIIKALNLNQLLSVTTNKRHPWLIKATSVNSKQGIIEGFEWLLNEMSTSIN